MWKYGFKIYEQPNSIGGSLVSYRIKIAFYRDQLQRSTREPIRMTVYLKNGNERDIVAVAMQDNLTFYVQEYLMVPSNAALYVAFEGVKNKEVACLAKSFEVFAHWHDKEMKEQEHNQTHERGKIFPTDVFNHNWGKKDHANARGIAQAA